MRQDGRQRAPAPRAVLRRSKLRAIIPWFCRVRLIAGCVLRNQSQTSPDEVLPPADPWSGW